MHVLHRRALADVVADVVEAVIDSAPVILETPRDEADTAAAALLAELEGARSS